MDRVQKVLHRLSDKERDRIKKILLKLNANNFVGLNIVKLKGHKDIFRIRSGNLRIIYQLKDRAIFVLAIERRKESTYRDF